MVKRQSNSSWPGRFAPRDYLERYYGQVDSENEQLLGFFAEVSVHPRCVNARVLDLGSGPTIYPIVSIGRISGEIHLADFLSENLHEVELWRRRSKRAFDWKNFIGRALALEQVVGISVELPIVDHEVEKREDLLRSKVTKLFRCDIRAPTMLSSEAFATYDLVISCFCIEHVAHDAHDFADLIKKVASVISAGGLLVLVSLWRGRGIRAGGSWFETVQLEQDDIVRAINESGLLDLVLMRTVTARPDRIEEYAGFILTLASRREG